ncbi:UPF0183 protein, partial [Mucuna pruriens]
MTTMLTKEYLDIRLNGWVDYALLRIVQLGTKSKKVGVRSLMNETDIPLLLAGNIYMEDVQVKLGKELYFAIGSQPIPFGASPQDW